MPIEIQRLTTRFLQVSLATTVCELVEVLTALPPETRNQWYIVVTLDAPGPQIVASASGGYTVVDTLPGYAVLLPVRDLADVAAAADTGLLDTPLSALPGLLQPVRMIARTTMGEGRARRDWLPGSPGRRLVVLEAATVIGLLTDEERAGAFGGIMTHLFGREQRFTPVAKGRVTYRCPSCPDGQNSYDFADLIDLSTNKLICPRGHLIQE
ncbi:MAG: hypothetical protein M1546_20870 [Chloroflexi bacterium]|nr:hypothetical protein [Chloroflexota bacterium]